MYVEGITDLMQMILMFPFSPPEAKEKNLDSIKERATNRYFPVFEKVSDSEDVPIKLVFTITRKFPPNKNMFVVQVSSKSSAFLALTKKGKYSSTFSLFVGLCCQGCGTRTSTKQIKQYVPSYTAKLFTKVKAST